MLWLPGGATYTFDDRVQQTHLTDGNFPVGDTVKSEKRSDFRYIDSFEVLRYMDLLCRPIIRQHCKCR